MERAVDGRHPVAQAGQAAARLPERPFAVEFWDGTRVAATADGGPTFFVRSPRAAAHVLGERGPLPKAVQSSPGARVPAGASGRPALAAGSTPAATARKK